MNKSKQNLTSKQAKILLELIQKTDMVGFFEKIDEFNINDTYLIDYLKEFVSGTYTFGFYDRLQVYINFLANTNYVKKKIKYDIFFSFSSENQYNASRVVQKLRQANFSVFFSDENIKNQIGQNFFDKVNDALEYSQHFILYCTPIAMNSDWVKSEYQAFYERYVKGNGNNRFFILEGESFNENILPQLLKPIQRAKELNNIINTLQNNSNHSELSTIDLANKIIMKTMSKSDPKIIITPKPKSDPKIIITPKPKPKITIVTQPKSESKVIIEHENKQESGTNFHLKNSTLAITFFFVLILIIYFFYMIML